MDGTVSIIIRVEICPKTFPPKWTPGWQRFVKMMLFFGLEPHMTRRSRENPDSMSDMLASTTFGEGTLLTWNAFHFFVANYAESRLSQSNLNQPDVAFCFMSAATYILAIKLG
jgi:hypothetical protein